MHRGNYETRILDKARDFIQNLEINDRAKVAAAIKTLESRDFKSVEIKTLQGPIKELIVRSHRLIFFISKEHAIYFVSGFRKQTRKTPKNEIAYARNIFKILNR